MNIAAPSDTSSSNYSPELYRDILCGRTPLLDVRAPIEYSRGAFPSAANLPLLDDEQRRLVGIRYKELGQSAAIALGEALISDKVRANLIEKWANWLHENPSAYLYCFRGGLRSQIVQQWLREAGINCPRVPGGYKAMRHFLCEAIEQTALQKNLILLAGATGSGKTDIIRQLQSATDLEGHALHRGSAFGARLNPQPSQINFENALAIDLLNLPPASKVLYLEDESQAIGSLSVPFALYASMRLAPIVHIHEPVEARAQRILEDYIVKNLQEFEHRDQPTAYTAFSHYLLESLDKIQKRLGPERHQTIKAIMNSALSVQASTGDTTQHIEWIHRLLQDYYDPMYQHQLNKRSERIIFNGNAKEFWSWHEAEDKALF